MQEWYHTNVAIVDDVVGEQDALDFAAKLKSVVRRAEGYSPIYYFFFPNYSKNELGYMLCGHHMFHDGGSMLQFLNSWSDNGLTNPYPFINARGLN